MEIDNYFQIVELGNELDNNQSIDFIFQNCKYWLVRETSNRFYISSNFDLRSLRCYIRTRGGLVSSMIRDAIEQVIIQHVHKD
jgi:hypothetical protein